MAVNLVALCKEMMGHEFVNQSSNFLGESVDGTSSAISTILPALIGGLIKKGRDEQGADSILDFIKTHDVNEKIIEETNTLFDDAQQVNNLIENGTRHVNFIFGKSSSTVGSILDIVSDVAGIGRSSTSSLLKVAGPITMAVLKNHIQSQSIDNKGLSKLLSQQVAFVQQTAPPGLLDRLDLGLEKLTSDQVEDKPVKKTDLDDEEEAIASSSKSTLLSRIIPWIILATVALVLWYGMHTCGGQPPEVVNEATNQGQSTKPPAVEQTGTSTSTDPPGQEPTSKANEFRAQGQTSRSVIDGMATLALPDGKVLEVEAGSLVDQLYTYLTGNPNKEGKRFLLDKVSFTNETSTMTQESMIQIQNTATLVDAFPNIHVRVEAHTDNTGNANSKMTLSEQRALAVKRELNSLGVSIEKLSSAGLGGQMPIADNNTPGGRATNQRVELVVTKN